MKIMTRFNSLEKYEKYSLAVIIIFSLIAVYLTSIYHVSGDGCWHIQAGKFLADNYKIPSFEPLGRDEPFWSPPLYHIFVAFIYLLFNTFNHNVANFAIKFVSPIFGILSLIFSFFVVKKLANSKIAFYSTLFLAYVPIFIDHSVISYVESMLVFFVILSVYFLINDKIFLSGMAAGFSILTKYNGVFILPLLVYFLYRKHANKKIFYKNAFLIVFLPLLIAAPWFLRNWAIFGNPVWPFLNFIFKGLELKSYSQARLQNLFHPNFVIFTYLGIFGVPDGNYAAFSFFNVPYFKFLLGFWLIGTLFFIIPLIIGFFIKNEAAKKQKNNLNSGTSANKVFFVVWLTSYLILFLLYVVNVGWSVSRIMLPAFPALAFFWASGYDKLMTKIKFGKMINLLTILVIIGFVFTSVIKTNLATNAWKFYQNDFDWVKSNTEKNSVFIANGQCVPNNIERSSLYAINENLRMANYIWINQQFKLDKRSIIEDNQLKLIESKNYDKIYSNKRTNTIIYKIK